MYGNASAGNFQFIFFLSVHLLQRENALEPDEFEASIAAHALVPLTLVEANSSIKTAQTTEVDHLSH